MNFKSISFFALSILLLTSMELPVDLTTNQSSSQKKIKTLTLSIQPLFLDKKLILNDKIYSYSNSKKISIETLKFYITNIKLFEKNKMVFSEQSCFHLLDLDNPKSMNIKLSIPQSLSYDSIQLGLGVDSTAHVGPMTGDLDPTKGMYWTWKSGYINFKLEGYMDGVKSRKNEFQYHLGGYQFGENCYHEINLSISNKKSSTINIGLDLHEFIQNLDLVKQSHIMSPGAEAVLLSSQLVKCFKIIKK